MSVSLPDRPCLAALVQAPGVHTETDFIADDVNRVGMLALAAGADVRQRALLRNKAVLLAMPTQLETVAALLCLDGFARRIVIWPHQGGKASLSGVVDRAGVDVVLTAWTLPDGATERPGGPAEAAGATPAIATEWVLFTSGTSGQPKMVVHTLESLCGHLARATAPRPRTQARAAPEWCTFYDIRRYGGMQVLLRALAGGGSLVLSSPEEKPGAFLARAGATGRTHFLGTPSHWRQALMARNHGVIRPAYVRLSGEVADQIILDRLRAAYPGAAIVHAFASTEAGLAFEVEDGLAGFPAHLVGAGEAGVDLDVSGGTLRIRSARRALGTLGDGIRPLAGPDGFIDTNDSVVRQGDRYHLAGRADGIVNVGGQKVHPEEVEAVINQHPAVQMSRVTARRSPITGAIVTAEVVSRAEAGGMETAADGAAARLERDIQAFCHARLAPFQVPCRVRLVHSLAISAAGKLVRLHA